MSWFSTHASSQSSILCAPVSLYPFFPTKTKRLFGQLPSWSTSSSRAPTLFEGLLLLVLQKHVTAGDKHNTQTHLNFVPPQNRPRPCCFTGTKLPSSPSIAYLQSRPYPSQTVYQKRPTNLVLDRGASCGIPPTHTHSPRHVEKLQRRMHTYLVVATGGDLEQGRGGRW